MKKLIKSQLFLQVIVASLVATLATAGIVGAATTIGNNITSAGTNTLYGATNIGGAITATSTLDVTGLTTLVNASTTQISVSSKSYLGTVNSGTWNGTIIGATYGGTGWGTINSNTVLLGNGTGAIATTSAGTAGYVLMYTSGAPVWVATSSVAAKGANSDITSLSGLTTALTAAQGGTGWADINANTVLLGNGTSRIATTSAGTNGYVLALSGGTPTWIATTTLSTITGTLAAANGGTGQTSFTSSNLLYGAGTGAIQNVATTSATLGLGLSYSTTLGALVGGTAGTLSIATSSLYTGATNQLSYFSGTNAISGLANTTNGYVLTLSGGTPTWVATTTYAATGANSDITSLSGLTTALTAAQGGTGWGTINSNTILLGNGANAIATTSAGTNGFTLALVNGVPTWAATTTLSTITGTLAAANGGTGWGTINANTVLLGNGTGAIATTSAGTNGYVLTLSAGVPTWIATTTYAATGANADITSLTAITSIDRTGAITIGNTNATALTIGRNTVTTTFPGTTSFTGATNVNGMATTTAEGIIIPNATSTTPTGYCNTTNAGGLLWVTASQRLCVCTGSSWQLATTTGACQ